MGMLQLEQRWEVLTPRKIKELRALAVSPELGAILDKNYNGASV